MVHDACGLAQGWIGGAAIGEPTDVGYSSYDGWSRIGAGGYGPIEASGFTGSLGAVVLLPYAADAAQIARMHAWAQGRFGAP